MNEGESVYDFCWYPYMSASGASANFFYNFVNFTLSGYYCKSNILTDIQEKRKEKLDTFNFVRSDLF